MLRDKVFGKHLLDVRKQLAFQGYTFVSLFEELAWKLDSAYTSQCRNHRSNECTTRVTVSKILQHPSKKPRMFVAAQCYVNLAQASDEPCRYNSQVTAIIIYAIILSQIKQAIKYLRIVPYIHYSAREPSLTDLPFSADLLDVASDACAQLIVG
jgi:hypothetical protein